MKRKLWGLLWGLAVLIVCQPTLSVAAPKANLWHFWQTSNEQNSHQINHQRWQQLLNQHLVVKPEGHLFNYNEVSASDKQQLARYIEQLSHIDPRQYKKQEQFAYWVNLYNALTVQLVLNNYPVSSIKKLGKGIFSFGPWDDEIIRIAGQAITLNDIEHRILRPIWQDQRIHYVVNCASLGCPDLATQALTADNQEQVLEAATKRFINQAKGVSFSKQGLVLSKIYDWYQVDFGDNETALIQHLQQYAQPALRKQLAQFKGDISYQYDWNLNEVKK
ncbi:DUF547 domain-containing protein [Spartinivicinus poritis]|uniref:DUF547 domain-containing protein n=1 Tax=Spartinivicinus poritis TaxID=2994640 RepID=A0ABT5UC44_9GAMM|nr:DUF547 domain-containing protein [Spartinivicinus sp. A2-2]MDE1463946.1 DUF547 domain-containing protein [Spartinivicinus sp. A2-2]